MIEPNHHKINPLTTVPPPNTVKGLRSFLGAIQVHANSIPGLINASHLLHELTGNDKKSTEHINWTPTLRQSFNQTQTLLKQPKTIHIPKPTDQLILVPDAAKVLPAINTTLWIVRRTDDG